MITGFVASNLEPDSERAILWGYHVQCGKFLVVGLFGRFIWGILGPYHAQFTALIHPQAWIVSLKTKKMMSADTDFGHHPQASISYLGFYALAIVMSFTGLVLAGIMHGEGPFADKLLDQFTYMEVLRDVHEYGWWIILFFVVTHVGALIFHEWYDRIPIAQSMISGFQYRTEKEEQHGKQR